MTERRTERSEEARRAPAERERAAAQPQDGPDKRHGDALREGNGTRHGVRRGGEEPDTCG